MVLAVVPPLWAQKDAGAIVGLVRDASGSGRECSAQQTGIGYKPATDSDSKKTVLLKDFHPESALHAAANEIQRPKFPVIDVQTHTNDAVGIGDRVDPREMIARMDRLNIKTIVILTGMWDDKLQTIIDDMVKPYPGRFVVFTQFDWSKINDPNFSQLMVRQINDSVARGARGLKVLKELGLGVGDSTGKLIPIDDPRLDPAWEECGRLGISVFIHVADPEAFFHPIDALNERYEELIEHSDWRACPTTCWKRYTTATRKRCLRGSRAGETIEGEPAKKRSPLCSPCVLCG
jgi:uncharacterized protein